MRLVFVLIYLSLLLFVSNIDHVECQELTKIIGKRGNVLNDDPNGDIIEVEFLIKDDSLTIRYEIAGNPKNTEYLYTVYLYDRHHQRFDARFGRILAYYAGDLSNAEYNDNLTHETNKLSLRFEDSSIIISDLKLDYIDNREVFYASALVITSELVLKGIVGGPDIEPRDQSGVFEKSYNNHAYIVIGTRPSPPDPLSINSNSIISSNVSTNTVIVDGKWSSPQEWEDATQITYYYANNKEIKDFIIHLKHDSRNIYLLLDVVADRYTKDSNGDIRMARIVFDSLNDKTEKPHNDDYYFSTFPSVYTEKPEQAISYLYIYNGNGTGWDNIYDEYERKGNRLGVESAISYDTTYNPYSKFFHTIYEFAIPLKIFGNNSQLGFGAYAVNWGNSQPLQLNFSLTENSNSGDPSTWANIQFKSKYAPSTTPATTMTNTPTTTKTSEFTQMTSEPSMSVTSKTTDYAPYYIIAIAVIVAGALVAFAIYRKK